MAGKQQGSRAGIEKYFFSIKKGVSKDWKDLADCLGLWDEVDNIESKTTNRDDESRCRDLLAVWKTRKGDAATMEVLMEALVKARLQSVVDDLRKEFPELREPQSSSSSSSQPSTSRGKDTSEIRLTKKGTDRAATAVVDEYFDEVIKEVSHKWDDLARKLGFNENEIIGIEVLKRDTNRRCREMLHRWRNREGREATPHVLKQALIDIGQKLTADSL
ncbi:THO complex subunit 1-like [Branchiostoma lanceolatum]|uniref:THO complex subunit 1-like n=1 Tax=Branchiostoma lanceolatum TaxID=7740 RepID=UPI003455D155